MYNFDSQSISNNGLSVMAVAPRIPVVSFGPVLRKVVLQKKNLEGGTMGKIGGSERSIAGSVNVKSTKDTAYCYRRKKAKWARFVYFPITARGIGTLEAGTPCHGPSLLGISSSTRDSRNLRRHQHVTQKELRARAARRASEGSDGCKGCPAGGAGRRRCLATPSSRKPPMGWRSWNLFELNVSQALIEAQIAGLTRRRHSVDGKPTSLLDLGYASIGLDDGWQDCGKGINHTYHSAEGTPLVNKTRFPDMGAMVAVGHAAGVQMGCNCAPSNPPVACAF